MILFTSMITKLATNFLDQIFKNIKHNQIDLKNYSIDHICYRTSSEANYLEVKNTFSQIATLLIESIVNGRMIATYKLHNPIVYNQYIIDLIEVPAPKIGKNTIEGFEHIEVVADSHFSQIQMMNPNLNFISNGVNKKINPEIEIEFNNCALKFHNQSLEQVINIEKHTELFEFIIKEELVCAQDTLIVGDYPLGLENSNSCFKILSTCKNPTLDKIFFKNIVIEIIKVEDNLFKHPEYQLMLLQAKILKIMGIHFSNKIIKLKAQGIDTKKAFETLLNLDDLQKFLSHLKTEAQLLKYFNEHYANN